VTGPALVRSARAVASTLGCVTFLGAALAPSARAQEQGLRPDVEFLERSEVIFGVPGLLLETRIAPHLFIHQRRTSDATLRYGGWSWALSVTPMVRVRIFRARSNPVETPSFMPKLNIQFVRLTNRSVGQPWAVRRPNQGQAIWLIAPQLIWGHHSNGQDGCTFENSAPPDCPVPPPPWRINRVNGNFSTNYLQLGLFFKRHYLREDGDWLASRHSVSFGLTGEANPPWLPPGGALEPSLRSMYGPYRADARVEAEWKFRGRKAGKLRLSGLLALIGRHGRIPDCGRGLPDRDCARQFGWSAEASYRFKGLDEMGAFARYYDGQDYYNLAFPYRLRRFQAGIAFDAGRYDDFRLPRIPDSELGKESAASDQGRLKEYRRKVLQDLKDARRPAN
jgi:hypothetical protein